MSKGDSGLTKNSAKKLFIGTLPLMVLDPIVNVLLFCGWLLRDDGWQTQLQIGRWLYLAILIVSVFITSTLLISTAKKRRMKVSTWCRNILSLLLSVAGATLLFQYDIVAAIYVIFIRSIVSPALDTFLGETPVVRRSSIWTCLFSAATIVAFALNMAALVFAFIIVQLFVLLRTSWIFFHDILKAKLMSETS